MRNVVLFGPSEGRKAGSRTIENLLPWIARWKVSAKRSFAGAIPLMAAPLRPLRRARGDPPDRGCPALVPANLRAK